MSRTKALKNVKLTSFDDLFGGKVVEETAETGDVKEIPISELHEFHNHPFQIRSDEELEEMIESVREHAGTGSGCNRLPDSCIPKRISQWMDMKKLHFRMISLMLLLVMYPLVSIRWQIRNMINITF